MRLKRADLADLGLTAAVTFVGVIGTAGADRRTDADTPLDALGLVLVVVAALTLAGRRRWPVVVAVTVSVAVASYLALGYTYGPILLALVVAMYTVARHRPLEVGGWVVTGAVAVLVVHLFSSEAATLGLVGVVPATAWVVVPFALGTTLRVSAESVSRTRADLLRRRVDDERLLIAQEVHDVVGHGLAAIKMQADVALHVLDKNPGQAETALRAISSTSTTSLVELRATLAVVRRTDGAPQPPAAGLEGVEALCERMRQAGLDVTLDQGLGTTDGTARLPAAVSLAGYRVVQESLTNVLRHGAAPSARVHVRREADRVELRITNPLTALPPLYAGRGSSQTGTPGGGLGIPGMRARVESLGGVLAAGPTEDGRFEVSGWLPVEGSE